MIYRIPIRHCERSVAIPDKQSRSVQLGIATLRSQ